MMTIETLSEYRKLRTAIDALNEEIESLYNPVSSISFDRYYKQTTKDYRGSTVRALEKIEQRREALSKTLEKYTELAEQIEEWIDTIDDPMIESIVRYRYILGKSWNETSKKVYGKLGKADSCRMMVKRYIEKQGDISVV